MCYYVKKSWINSLVPLTLGRGGGGGVSRPQRNVQFFLFDVLPQRVFRNKTVLFRSRPGITLALLLYLFNGVRRTSLRTLSMSLGREGHVTPPPPNPRQIWEEKNGRMSFAQFIIGFCNFLCEPISLKKNFLRHKYQGTFLYYRSNQLVYSDPT